MNDAHQTMQRHRAAAGRTWEHPLESSTAAVPRWKRFSDCLIAGPLLLLTAPIMLVSIAVVRLTSRGPAIYSQTRLGLNRRPFTIYKIRSMTHNCEAKTGARWATAKDARVTPFGRFLRLSHIDELPQLWNVLRGDMTLVGPRPERPEIVKEIEPLVPGYGKRLSVLPGVTGLAQVQLPPDSNLDSVRRKIRYDAYYAANFSLSLDLRLIATTAFKCLGLVRVSRSIFCVPCANVIEPAHDATAAESTRPAFSAGSPAVEEKEAQLTSA